jgi:hypothetical protein
MSNAKQIKTHFDSKIITFFIIFFLFSCLFLVYKIKNQPLCTISGFKIESKSFKAKELITFIDTTTNVSQWKWNFGDGSNPSNLSKAVHSYENPGTYLVKLEVDNDCSVEKIIEIKPYSDDLDMTLMPSFVVPKNIVKGIPVTFVDKTPHAKSWVWSFGEDGDVGKFDSTIKNPTHTFSTTGLKKIKLVVNDDYKYVTIIDVFVKEPKIDVKPQNTVEIKKKEKIKPERPNVTAEDIEAMMRGIAKNELSFRNFSKYFCRKLMPEVHLKDGKVISLKELDELIRDAGKVNIKKVIIQKDENGCVTRIDANFKL